MKSRLHCFLLAALAMLVAASAPASPPDSTSLGSIGGVIRDADRAQPVGYANVVLVGSRRGTLTDEAGRFFIPGVTPGTQRLLVQSLGFAPLRRHVVVRAGETARVDAVMIGIGSRRPRAPYSPGPDSTLLEDLAEGFTVRVFRLSSSPRRDPALPTPDSSRRVWSWPVAREMPPPAMPAWRERLVALLADSASYVDPAAAAKLCVFRPEVGIRLTGRDDVFELLLCFQCARLAVHGRFHAPRGGDFDARAPEWVALAREALPGDSLLRAIGGGEIPTWTDWAMRRCELEGADDRRGR